MEGSSSCIACPIGSYSDVVGSTSCSTCPAGRTTALTAAVSVDACQSPTTSFAMGLVGTFVGIVLATMNIFASRYQIIAFVRRIRIVDPISYTCKRLMCSIDKIKQAMFTHKQKAMDEEQSVVLLLPNHLRTLRNLCKLIFMGLGMLSMTLLLMMICFGRYLLQIFYHTFVLWRGLRFDFSLNSDFAAIMNSVLSEISVVVDVPYISTLLLVFYPITVLLAKLSSIHLNLNSVNVSCSGSQAPLELVINIIVLGIFTIFINSNYQALIAVPVAGILKSSIEVVLFYDSRAVMNWRLLRWLFSLIYLGALQVILSMRPIVSSLQYLMSFTSVQSFLPYHNYTSACNNIEGFIGIDSALANISTFLVYLCITPVIYTVATVMVPGLPINDIIIPFFGNITHTKLFVREHVYVSKSISFLQTDKLVISEYIHKTYGGLKLLCSPDVIFMYLISFQSIQMIVTQVCEKLILKVNFVS